MAAVLVQDLSSGLNRKALKSGLTPLSRNLKFIQRTVVE
jgi:hypothetical protein